MTSFLTVKDSIESKYPNWRGTIGGCACIVAEITVASCSPLWPLLAKGQSWIKIEPLQIQLVRLYSFETKFGKAKRNPTLRIYLKKKLRIAKYQYLVGAFSISGQFILSIKLQPKTRWLYESSNKIFSWLFLIGATLIFRLKRVSSD